MMRYHKLTAIEGETGLLHPARKIQFLSSQLPDVPDCFVSLAEPDAPTLVAIHGISRNAAEIAARFASHPLFQSVNIVAPLFEKKRFGKYQLMLAKSAKKTSSGRAIFRLLEELEVMNGMHIKKVLLFGFSGGAQMAHRLAMLYPDRISRLCAVSAGWYLMPDHSLSYPYGLGEGCPVINAGTDFFDIPTTVIVGTRDTRVDASVRQDQAIVSRQGRNRLERGRAWVGNVTECATKQGKEPKATLLLLKNGSHDFGLCARDNGLLDLVADALL